MNENKELAKGLIMEKKGFSLVWIAPIVAILITTGMIYKSYIDKGSRIYIVIENGDGIKDGKTPIMYKGIKIGAVEDIHIKDDDVSKLEITAIIDKQSSAAVTRKGNKFWKVSPKITLTEISGLDTIVGGVYISVMPAENSKEALLALPYEDHFIGLEAEPVNVFNPGIPIIVNTNSEGDIAIGAPVLYNKQVIGKIEDKKLSEDRLSIDLYLRIESKYADLIHQKSIFYKANAIEVKASLSEFEVNIDSFASFVAGGITIKNTDESLASPLAKNKEYFNLYDNEKATHLSNNEIMLVMKEPHNLTPKMSKIFCNGVEAGVVSSLEYEAQTNVTNVKLKLFNNFRRLANERAYFWIVKPTIDFNKIEGLDAVVRGNYINFITSDHTAKIKSTFILNEKKPQVKGMHLELISDDIESLREGASIFYHSIEIGTIDSYKINKDKTTFTINAVILPEYKNLLNSSSVFYHKSGIEFKADYTRLELNTGSLETMLRGGIAVETPDFKANSKLKEQYKLYKSKADVVRAKYLSENGLYLTLVANSLGSLKKDSSIFFKQIKVGEVLSYKWDNQSKKLILKAFIVEEYANEVNENTVFYNASGIRAKLDLNGLSVDTESFETIMSGGIAFYTPPDSNIKKARNNTIFGIHETKEEAMSNFLDLVLIGDDSAGLERGSAIKYKNVVLGHVDEITLMDGRVQIKVKLDAKHKNLINKNTVFWLETFEVGLSGVKNPSAAVKGPYISIKPGSSEDTNEVYYLMPKSPMPHFDEDGLRIVVEANMLANLKENTPVYYRQIKIGSVVQYRLNTDSTKVDIELFIEPCFAHLIRDNSYFYNMSGIGMEINLLGAKMQTDSVESILTGGIGVFTPNNYSKQSENDHAFILHDDFNKEALKWSPVLHNTDTMCQ